MTDSSVPSDPVSGPAELGQSDESAAREMINNLEREFGTLIRRGQSTAARMSERVHPDLAANAYPLLVHIGQHPQLSPSDLAEHFGIGRATTSRQLTRLVDLGLVHRAVDAQDCRRQELSLTADGRARLDDAQTRRRQWYRRILADWSEDELATFTVLLSKFARAVESPGEDAATTS